MRVVAQRVSSSRVFVDGEVSGEISAGLCVLVGVAPDDTESDVQRLAKKLIDLRVFEDGNGKMNLSLADIKGEMLAVSQFTLFADCRKGRRPSFVGAAGAEKGKQLYDLFVDAVRGHGIKVGIGVFGADMRLEITNEGPVTIIIDSADLGSA